MNPILYKWSNTDFDHMRAILLITGRAWVARNQNGELRAHRTKPFQGGAFGESFWISGEVTCELCPDILVQIVPGALPVNIEAELLFEIQFDERITKTMPSKAKKPWAFSGLDVSSRMKTLNLGSE